MAKALNKNRMLYSELIFLTIFLLGLGTNIFLMSNDLVHELMELGGYILVIICAFGRVFATAFIGGVKNEKLITWGPYSLCRNPLYFFSYVGIVGIALASTSWVAVAVAVVGVYVIYDRLIRREEGFLAERFGADFQAYQHSTPRFFPRLVGYHAPNELVFQPRFLFKSVADAVWWFMPLPLFEAIEYLEIHTHLDIWLRGIVGL